MSGIYRWSMRDGAKLLFALALLLLLIGLIPLLSVLTSETSQMAANYSYVPAGSEFPVALYLQLFATALQSAALPFFAALLIHRIDRRLATADEVAGK